jgi:hypothetical protein
LSAVTPIIFLAVPAPSGKYNWETFKNLMITFLISVLAYQISSHLISKFKDVLCTKGMFGKDLNKAGERDKKEKV